VLKVWRAGVPTVAVALLSSALIVLDLNDGAFRRWWSARAFTTDAIAGILIVLITVLIVNQVLEIRRNRERFRATAAQASMGSRPLSLVDCDPETLSRGASDHKGCGRVLTCNSVRGVLARLPTMRAIGEPPVMLPHLGDRLVCCVSRERRSAANCAVLAWSVHG
jgi:hypothetical protein